MTREKGDYEIQDFVVSDVIRKNGIVDAGNKFSASAAGL
jgi:hypothetical protein